MATRMHQRGFILGQMIIVIAVFGIIVGGLLKYVSTHAENQEFEGLGNKLSEHSTAVTEWLIDQGATASPATYTTMDWLKSNANCGITSGGTTAYLPCDFSFTIERFGGTPTSVVTNSGGVTSVVTTWPALNEGGHVKVIGAARAVIEAEASNRDALKGVVIYSEDNNAVITATVSLNNSTSIYVKRSGDSMTGDLDLGGNDLNNVGVISASSATFNTSSLGNATATSLNTNGVAATAGNITSLQTTTVTAIDGTITNLTATNFTTSVMTVNGAANISSLDGNLQITRISAQGGACAGAGEIARTVDGDLLSCKNSTWQFAMWSGASIDYSACYNVNHGKAVSYNACPTGYVFRGGYRRGSDSGEWNGFSCCKLK